MGGVNEDFELDTSSMDAAAEACTRLAEKMKDLRQSLEDREIELIDTWEGHGSTAFQKKFNHAKQLLTDIKDELYDMAESIYTAESSYLETDMETAKALDGVTSFD